MRNRNSSIPFVIGAVCLLLPVVVILFPFFRSREEINIESNFYGHSEFVEANTLKMYHLRPSQIIYLDKEGYRVALHSDEHIDYVEDKQHRINDLSTLEREASDLLLQNKNNSEDIVHAYEEGEEKSDAERDETIDYNLAWQENPTAAMKRTRCTSNLPFQNIVLIKTHRTGSSTLANILYRYGDLNNLEFALPKGKTFEFYWPLHFNPSFVHKKFLNSSKPNMLINAKYNLNTMKMLVGKNAFLITILRNPATHFESAFYSNRLDSLFGLENSSNPMQEFLARPHEYVKDYLQSKRKLDFKLNTAVNGQFFDLGLQHKYYSDTEVINRYLEELTESINLVLITEHLDESLILLKRELCWDADDVLYFRLRRRSSEYKELNVTVDMKKRIIAWNKADVALYNHFNKTLWDKIGNQDPSFFDEVKELRMKIQKLEEECIEAYEINEETGELKIKVYKNLRTVTFDRYLCDKMRMSENDYTAYLKEKMSLKFSQDSQYVKEQFERRRNETKRYILKEDQTFTLE